MNNQVSLFSWQKCLKYIQEKLPVLYEQLPDKNKRALKRPSVILNARMEFLSSSVDHAVTFGNFKTRLQLQQSVVCSPKINNHKAINNFVQLLNIMIQVTQQDSEVNLALARETKELAAASKQDSSAMKIIAFLTTVFLPGTFIAVHALSISTVKILIKSQTLFSTPFFNWDADSVAHAANSNFWFYWAITGPLTLATMFIVIVWAVWRYRKTEKLRKEARESSVLGDKYF